MGNIFTSFRKEKIFAFALIIFGIFSYFIGFYFREISNGAGHNDLEFHIWLLVNDFENNLFETLQNYLSYKEATFPFFHLFQAIFNPFKSQVIYYCLSNTFFNLIILLIFSYFLKKKKIFKSNENFLILLTACILLFSPWFRSSSFWGMTENFSLFFLIPSLYYFSKLCENNLGLKSNIILTVLISLTIYSRQQYIFLPLSHILILLIDKKFKQLIHSILIYTLLSFPGLYAFNLWSVFENISNATSASDYISLKNIFYNIPKISTLILFYLAPIIIINYKKYLNIIFSKKFLLIFIIIFIIEYLLFDKISYSKMGGGFIIKFNSIFFNNSVYLILLVSSFFFSILVVKIKSLNYRYHLILFLTFVIIGLPEYLFQEWFDPIYLFVYFIFLPKPIILANRLNLAKSIYFLILWEIAILVIALFYYHYYIGLPMFYKF